MPTRFFKGMKTKGKVNFQVGSMHINEMPLKESKLFVKISTLLQAIDAGLKPPSRADH